MEEVTDKDTEAYMEEHIRKVNHNKVEDKEHLEGNEEEVLLEKEMAVNEDKQEAFNTEVVVEEASSITGGIEEVNIEVGFLKDFCLKFVIVTQGFIAKHIEQLQKKEHLIGSFQRIEKTRQSYCPQKYAQVSFTSVVIFFFLTFALQSTLNVNGGGSDVKVYCCGDEASFVQVANQN